MAIISWIVILMIVQTSSQQGTFSYREPLEATPSPVCVGGSVIIRCVIVFTDDNDMVTPVTASFRRFANNTPITSTTVNHQLMRNGSIVVAVVVSDITPDDNNTIYTCTNDVDTENFATSIMLEVAGPPSVLNFQVFNNCGRNATILWRIISDPVCGPMSHNVTVSPSVEETMSSNITFYNLTNISYYFADLNHSVIYNVTINASNKAGSIEDVQNFTTAGPPSLVGTVTIIKDCLSFVASWENVTSDPVCGPVSYDVTISPSDGVVMRRITDTSYSFTGLQFGTNYTVTVAGRNDADVGGKSTMNVNTNGMFMITHSSTTTTAILMWIVDGGIYCGEVMEYNVTLPTGNEVTTDKPTYTLSDLECENSYRVTITASFEENEQITSSDHTFSTDDCDDPCPPACIAGITAGVVLFIIIVEVIAYVCFFNYLHKMEKSGDEPNPIIIGTFLFLTLFFGWCLYKYLTKSKGPSKIGMQDTEKTPSPVDEPVVYATAEADKVKLGTSDSTDTKKKKQKKPEKEKKPANQGGITYADIDIGKGPAAPGSIFPQEKPTYGQVKPSN